MSYKKRANYFWIMCRSISGSIFSFLTESLLYAGCTGDCMRCHIKLQNDDTHIALKACVNCHKDENKKPFIISTLQGEGCGNDCFKCHDQWPKNGHHADLDKCQGCHKK